MIKRFRRKFWEWVGWKGGIRALNNQMSSIKENVGFSNFHDCKLNYTFSTKKPKNSLNSLHNPFQPETPTNTSSENLFPFMKLSLSTQSVKKG